jgi:mannose-6-phosphate isomerase-like protein (cupin superfamily)
MLTSSEYNALLKIKHNKPFVIRNTFHNLLSITEFESLLNLTPFTNSKRFRGTFPVERFEWQLPNWNTGTDHWPIDIVKKVINAGVCYMTDCSRATRKINVISSNIESLTNRPVDAHIYFSKSKSLKNGFGIHKDFSDNFIVQVDGETHWQVGGKTYYEADRNINKFKEDDAIFIDTILQPGDAIFIPANVYHSPKNLSKRISVSFPSAQENAENFEQREWLKWNEI